MWKDHAVRRATYSEDAVWPTRQNKELLASWLTLTICSVKGWQGCCFAGGKPGRCFAARLARWSEHTQRRNPQHRRPELELDCTVRECESGGRVAAGCSKLGHVRSFGFGNYPPGRDLSIRQPACRTRAGVYIVSRSFGRKCVCMRKQSGRGTTTRGRGQEWGRGGRGRKRVASALLI